MTKQAAKRDDTPDDTMVGTDIMRQLQSAKRQDAGGKVVEWVNSLGEEDREAFIGAAVDPTYSTQGLLDVAEKNGLQASHSAMRRFREMAKKGRIS